MVFFVVGLSKMNVGKGVRLLFFFLVATVTRGSSVDYSGKRDRLLRMASRPSSTDGSAAGAGINAARREPKEAGAKSSSA